jgi:hypothetical protein
LAQTSNGIGIKVATQAGGGSVTVNLINTIAKGGSGPNAADLKASTQGNGTATINSNHSDWALGVGSGVGAAVNSSATDQGAAPVFEPGSYRESPNSSATLGKGVVDPNNGATDFEGDLRSIGGSTDIGADQYVVGPSVSGVSGAGVDGTAMITAAIDTHGSPTAYSVVYGPTTAYGSTSPTLSLAPATTPQTVSISLTGLTPGATYHYAIVASNNGGTAAPADNTFTTAVTPSPPPGTAKNGGSGTGGSGAGAGVPTPQDGELVFSHSTFAAQHRGHPTADKARRHAAPVGALVSYTDSQAATTTLTVSRRLTGFFSHGSCVTGRWHARTARRCVRYVTVGSLTHRDRAGLNRLRFVGVVAGRTLRPGSYRMTAVPVDAAHRHGSARSHLFTIVPH